MYILGIHFGHNATAVLMKDGRVLGCVSEERLNGIKNYIGFPEKAVNYLLKEYQVKPQDLDFVTLPYRYSAPIFGSSETKKDLFVRLFTILYFPAAVIRNVWAEIEYHLPFLRKVSWFFYNICVEIAARQTIVKEKTSIAKRLEIDKNKVVAFDHHLAHGAAAYYASPYNKEGALIFTLDGEGDKLCATVSAVIGGEIKRLASTPLGNSLGWIYMEATRFLGMKPGEHEYKVMGLAPYAKSYDIDKVYEKIKSIVTLDEKNPLVFKSKFDTHKAYKWMSENLKFVKFVDVAGAFQRLVEDLVVEWIKAGIKQTSIKTVVAGGGVFMNVKANLKIAEIEEIEKFFVCPTAGDESAVLGAAYLAYLSCGNKTIEPVENLYWGQEFSDEEIAKFIKDSGYDKRYTVEKIADIEKRAAELLAKDKVLARVSGRMEWGARALGNRSILANPKDPDTVRLINEQVKGRDFWMPFTPSILKERADDYIVNPKRVPAKFMAVTFHSTALARKELRAAMHPYDFTVRPQLVDEINNPRYYKLIKEFEKLTGIGGILNTSFNLHGKPIVLGPKEAFEAFENSGLEYLILENYLISK